MKIPKFMPPIIIATALIAGGPAVAGVQAASETGPQHVEQFDLSWCTEDGATVGCYEDAGLWKVFVLPDGRASLTFNSRLRIVTTRDGVVVAESVEHVNEQIRIGLGQEFVIHRIEARRSSDGEACTTNVVIRWGESGEIAVDRTNGPACA